MILEAVLCGDAEFDSNGVQYHNSPGGVSRAGDNLVVIQEATAGQVT